LESEHNPWNTPLLAAPKKSRGKVVEGNIQLYLDFHVVNEKMRSADYTVPLVSTMFAHTKDATIFTKLDLANTFHQVKTERKSVYILGFTDLEERQCI